MKRRNFCGKARKGMMALTFSAALCASLTASAEDIEVTKFKYVGPYNVATPWMLDSVNVKAEKYSAAQLLDSPSPSTNSLGARRLRHCPPAATVPFM